MASVEADRLALRSPLGIGTCIVVLTRKKTIAPDTTQLIAKECVREKESDGDCGNASLRQWPSFPAPVRSTDLPTSCLPHACSGGVAQSILSNKMTLRTAEGLVRKFDVRFSAAFSAPHPGPLCRIEQQGDSTHGGKRLVHESGVRSSAAI